MPPLFLVAIGGALGACARFGLVALVKPHAPTFPVGTLVCNLLGCAAIGLLAGWLTRWTTGVDAFRVFVFVGVLGGFTTFSSLALELSDMLRDQRWGAAAAYLLISNIVGVGLAIGGYVLTASRVSAV